MNFTSTGEDINFLPLKVHSNLILSDGCENNRIYTIKDFSTLNLQYRIWASLYFNKGIYFFPYNEHHHKKAQPAKKTPRPAKKIPILAKFSNEKPCNNDYILKTNDKAMTQIYLPSEITHLLSTRMPVPL